MQNYNDNKRGGNNRRDIQYNNVEIKAPFNFVPLSEKVYLPNWADQVSQDIPFEDGISGVIEVKLTSQSPIFVRNGHSRDDQNAKNETYKSFSKSADNRYFIPATTIKGCIRSVLEIMSFGKMSMVQNSSFGLRDLNKTDYRENVKNVSCGWLQETNDGYVLYDWGEPGRISAESIDKQFNTKLAQFVKENNFKDDSNKTAKYKYMLTNAESACKTALFSKDDELQAAKLKANKIEPRKFYKFGGNLEGVLVFTGQPSQRKQKPDKKTGKLKWTGKYYEFVFLKPQRELAIKVSDELANAFKSIHSESPDYKEFWSQKLKRGERIPVFFKKLGDRLHSIGIAYMYKYPYQKSVYDAIPNELKNPDKKNKKEFKMDLPECMLGYTFNDNALKGRIHFGHAFAIGQPTSLSDKVFVSATPHPSFYPLYVNGGSDWNNAKVIAGRKRYPIKNQVDYKNEGTANMTQICSMLNKGVSFTERISFYNLKKIELGALLSALTFHGMNEKCFHNLGFGKSFGYGKIKASDIKLHFTDTTIKDCLIAYEDAMEDFLSSDGVSKKSNSPFAMLSTNRKPSNWLNSLQLKELFAMAIGIPSGMENKFQYLKMSTNPSESEFKIVKDEHQSLKSFSSITGVCVDIESARIYNKDNNESPDLNNKPAPEITFVPTDLKIGQVVTAKCIREKCVNIEGCNYEIQMTIPKIYSAKDFVGKIVKVEIKQISKTGKISQVSYLD